MFKILDINVDQMIDSLDFYKQTDVDNEDKESKKYYIDSLMDGNKDYPVGGKECMNKLNNLVRHKFLYEEFKDVESN